MLSNFLPALELFFKLVELVDRRINGAFEGTPGGGNATILQVVCAFSLIGVVFSSMWLELFPGEPLFRLLAAISAASAFVSLVVQVVIRQERPRWTAYVACMLLLFVVPLGTANRMLPPLPVPRG